MLLHVILSSNAIIIFQPATKNIAKLMREQKKIFYNWLKIYQIAIIFQCWVWFLCQQQLRIQWTQWHNNNNRKMLHIIFTNLRWAFLPFFSWDWNARIKRNCRRNIFHVYSFICQSTTWDSRFRFLENVLAKKTTLNLLPTWQP